MPDHRRARMHLARSALLSLLTTHAALGVAAAQSCPISPLTGAPSCGAAIDPGGNPFPGPEGTNGFHVGNPIEAIGGNKYEAALDFRSIVSPLAFVRHYNSALADADRGLGHGWRHGYDTTLARVDADRLIVVQGDGRTIAFDRAAPREGDVAERYAATLPGDGRIALGPEGGRWSLPDGRTMRFRGPWLVGIDDPIRGDLELLYRNRRLVEVRAETGVSLRLEWRSGAPELPEWGADPSLVAAAVPAGHLDALVLPDGSRIEYGYSSAHTLVRAARTAADDASPDPATASYRYDDVDWPRHLTAATRVREGAARTTRWRYDGDGRAEAQLDADGRAMIEMRRGDAPAGTEGAGNVRIEHRDGRSVTLDWSLDPANDPARFDRRLRVETTRRMRRPGEPFDAVTPPPAPPVPNPVDGLESIDAASVRLAATLAPVSGSLDASPPSHPRLRVLGTVDGRVRDVAFGDRTLADVLRALPETGAARCGAAASASDWPERLASAAVPCVEDIERAGAFVVAVEELAVARPGSAVPDTTVRRRVPPRDRFCDLPGTKDCDDLREDHAMAGLSACVYRTGHPCPSGWNAVDPASLGLAANDFSIGRFHSEIFYSPTEDRHVLVFRGTDDIPDWYDNIVQGVYGTATGQYERAIDLAKQLELQLLASGSTGTLTMTGHSLGGGLATTAALQAGVTATVFNPASLNILTAMEQHLPYREAGTQVDVVRVQGDAISRLQVLTRAPGTHTVLARPRGTYDWQSIELHGMHSVLASIEEYLDEHCTP